MPKRTPKQLASSPLAGLSIPPDEMSNDLSKYVTTAQAANLLGVKQRRIQALLKNGIVKGMQLGHDWLVFTPSLEKYYTSKSNRGRPASGKPKIQIKLELNKQEK
jgi:excisionase family DNA binding protein